VPVTEPIRVRKETKEELNRLKVHPRETYDDVITRLIEEYKRCKSAQG
jgi:predicted CopG family antitoxin